MDVGTLAIIAAGGAVIGVAAYLSLPRYPEDYFELSNAELLELTTASGPPYAAPLAGGLQNTAEHHQPDCGPSDVVECSASPPPIIGSSRVLLSGSESGGAAVQSSSLEGGPVSSIVSSNRGSSGILAAATDGAVVHDQDGPVFSVHPGGRREHSCPVCESGQTSGGCGSISPAVPVQRDRPALFRVK